jgi:hypothetical protein
MNENMRTSKCRMQKNRMEGLELRSIVSEMKYSRDGLRIRLDVAKRKE